MWDRVVTPRKHTNGAARAAGRRYGQAMRQVPDVAGADHMAEGASNWPCTHPNPRALADRAQGGSRRIEPDARKNGDAIAALLPTWHPCGADASPIPCDRSRSRH
jgi:hypothetical protein